MSQPPAQPLPSFTLASTSGHHKTVLPNLFYPSRPHSHVYWSGSLAPLRFGKNLDVRSCPTLAFSYASATAPTGHNITTDESEDKDDSGFWSVLRTFRGVRGLLWHQFLIFISKLRLLVRKVIRIGSAAPSTDALTN